MNKSPADGIEKVLPGLRPAPRWGAPVRKGKNGMRASIRHCSTLVMYNLAAQLALSLPQYSVDICTEAPTEPARVRYSSKGPHDGV